MKFKKIRLTEATLGDAVQDSVNGAVDVLGGPTKTVVDAKHNALFDDLDKCLKAARNAKRHGKNTWVNLLLVGLAGIGKTARLRAWAQDRGVNLVIKSAASMDAGDLGGALAADLEAKRAIKLSTSEMDQLDEVPSVLFLDELNRGRKDVRGTLLTLVQDHCYPDASKPGGINYLKNFLFTVAAVNPSEEDIPAFAKEYGWKLDASAADSYDTDRLDDAEKSRFKVRYMIADPIVSADHLYNQYKADAEMDMEDGEEESARENLGRADLAKTILTHPHFSFDTPNDIANSKKRGNGLQLNPRTFEMVLNACDGTKADFLREWNGCANSLRKPDMELILTHYEDKNDKANDAIKTRKSRSTVLDKNSAIGKIMGSGSVI